MIFYQLNDFRYSQWLEHVNNKLACYKDEVPLEILEEFKKINDSYKKIHHRDFIQILPARPKENE